MAHPGQNKARIFGISLRVMMLAIVAAALFPSTAYAQTITFNYQLTCDIRDPNCTYSSLKVASSVGDTASDYVTAATVNSDVPGYNSPIPIDGGFLNFQSAPATEAQYYPAVQGYFLECSAKFDNPGGSAAITGSVFGLPGGSNLLGASFLVASSSLYQRDVIRTLEFSGAMDISYVNPVLLANLGMAGLPNYGTGSLADDFRSYGPPQNQNIFYVNVSFTPSTNRTQTLHSFTGGIDGALPSAGLTMDKAGNLYGVTYSGGSAGHGTVFQLKHVASGWIFNTLYSFRGGNDGANPLAKVAVGPDAILYGTTQYGGDNSCSSGCGTVFSLRPPPRACTTVLCPWTETVLYRFKGGTDGAEPWSILTFDQSGNMYGTTYGGGGCGGGSGNCGVVYELSPSNGGWTESVLHRFNGGGDGGQPTMGLILDQSGSLYGTNAYGGDFTCDHGAGCGTIFQLSPSGSGWTENVLHTFDNSDGYPTGDLILDASGNLYDSASNVIFMLTPSGGMWTYGVLYGKGASGISMDTTGSLYGGGTDTFYGSLFKLTPSDGNWTYSVLYEFTGGSDGEDPYGAVVFDATGNLYSTTQFGGNSGNGVVFELPHQ